MVFPRNMDMMPKSMDIEGNRSSQARNGPDSMDTSRNSYPDLESEEDLSK